jgi:hypothetical protein
VTARTRRLRGAMEQAAREEGDHLRWCSERLEELDDRVWGPPPGSPGIAGASGSWWRRSVRW